MPHTAYKIKFTYNAYGDYVVTNDVKLKCHFRHITRQMTEPNENIDSDAMAWFMPDADIAEKDLIKFEDTYYRVERLWRARKLRKPNVQFIKTELKRYGAIS